MKRGYDSGLSKVHSAGQIVGAYIRKPPGYTCGPLLHRTL